MGFAVLNGFFHDLTGVNMSLYVITDWLSILPLAFVVGFACLGLIQWIKRKKLKHVDYSLFVLGGFYVTVLALFVLFEFAVVNYRPVLIDGVLEASYPSSTTMLVLCVIPTAIHQLYIRVKNKPLQLIAIVSLALFAVFMLTARLLSGVHWLTDIIGGTLLSASLVMIYFCFVDTKS